METPLDIMKITAQIVCAHVSTALVGTEELPALVGKVFDVLCERAKPMGDENRSATPAYDVSRCVTDDAIYSLIDGRPYKKSYNSPYF